ncbi:MAG: cobalt transporter CbiM [Desulfarculaceae bacterium]|nr:cobalt transporter CbiM [Desulfarculaceae bacterium]MCF8074138.1 cobalt transporter CbiM [Desulfarculaceae bacterium]MCF8103270.1 cobalt transporter CbiM [Desulfarculaceae bacterium]MCF8116872.1 cobalt transporter CbiM [Desulfarculaceae bacterium]
MHIAEGVLTAPLLGGGAALTAAGLAVGLKKMDYDRLPRVALLAAVFFVASLIHVPVGPASVHLVLNGLVGLLLGWAAFPAIFVGLVLQAVLFQYGGLTALGVNTFCMAAPALLSYALFAPLARRGGRAVSLVAGFAAGSLAVLVAALLVALSLWLTGEAFLPMAQAVVLANLPVMLIEGVITALIVQYLRKARPAMLQAGRV